MGKKRGKKRGKKTSQAGRARARLRARYRDITGLFQKRYWDTGFAQCRRLHESPGASARSSARSLALEGLRQMLVEEGLEAARTRLESEGTWLASSPLFQELTLGAALLAGDLGPVVSLVADPSVSVEERERAHQAILHWLPDPGLLARAEGLQGHPLGREAARVLAAFEAVTSGTGEAPVECRVARRSPLNGWAALVEAIDALHREDGERLEGALARLPRRGIFARLDPVWGAAGVTLPGNGSPLHLPQGPAVSALLSALRVGERLGTAARLRRLEDHLEAGRWKEASCLFRDLAQAAPLQDGGRLKRLALEVARRWIDTLEPFDMLQELCAETLGKEHGLHTLALASESVHPTYSALCWKLLGSRRLDLPSTITPGRTHALRLLHAAQVMGSDPSYCPECRVLHDSDLAPFVGDGLLPDSPLPLLQEAHEVHPCPETFTALLDWYEGGGTRHAKETERLARDWHRQFPEDTRPLSVLARCAAARGSLRKAVRHADEAHRLSPTDTTLGKLRFTLRRQAIEDRVRRGKHRAAVRDLEQLAGAAGPAAEAASLYERALLWHLARQQESEEGQGFHLSRLEAELGTAAARCLIHRAGSACRTGPGPSLEGLRALSAPDLFSQASRYLRCLATLDLSPMLPKDLVSVLDAAVRKDAARVAEDDLLALGDAALEGTHLDLAFGISAEGLGRPGGEASFLLQRARAWTEAKEARRAEGCLIAAMFLARSQDDGATLSRCRRELSRMHSPYHDLPADDFDQEDDRQHARKVVAEERRLDRCPPRRRGRSRARPVLPFGALGNPLLDLAELLGGGEGEEDDDDLSVLDLIGPGGILDELLGSGPSRRSGSTPRSRATPRARRQRRQRKKASKDRAQGSLFDLPDLPF